GHLEERRPSHAVEIEPRIETAPALDPTRPERHLVLTAIDDARVADERRLEVVVHVLARTRRDEPQDVVPGLIGIGDDLAVAMRPEDGPVIGAALEVAVRNQARCGAVRLDDDEVIDPNLSSLVEAQDELVPAARSDELPRDHAIAVLPPL